MKFSIPAHWSKKYIEKALQYSNNSEKIKLNEVYGVADGGGPVSHARSTRRLTGKVTKKQAEEFRNYLNKKKVKLVYLLNAPYKLSAGDEEELDKYIDWILNDLKPDSLKIASKGLMEKVREKDSKVPIQISTVAGVKTIEELASFEKFNPFKITIHEDSGKDWDNLEKLIEYGANNDIEIQIFVSLKCLYRCTNREDHYKQTSQGKDKGVNCSSQRKNNPAKFLLAGGAIRPEDLGFYHNKFGVDDFKISGRCESSEYISNLFKSYVNGCLDGNYLNIFPTTDKSLYINNKSLEGFISEFPGYSSYEKKMNYCNEWAVRLYKKGKLYYNGKGNYFIEDNRLKFRKSKREMV